MNKNLVLIGGGGHCKSVIDVAEGAGYTILGILDKAEEFGKDVLAYKVIGNDNDIPKFINKALFVITIGQIKNNVIRKEVATLIEKAGGKYATVIASDAYVSKYAIIGEGSVIMHNVIVNAGATVGKNCIINTMANLEHDVQVGDFCHVSTGSIINGDAKVGNNSFVGSRTVFHNCITVCDDVVIAAGSVVSKDINLPGIYAGNPAKIIR